jgi:hypothetical protein
VRSGQLATGRWALSGPERLGLVGLVAAGAAGVWPALTGATGVTLACPLRAVTGIPCPICGMTTATVALVRGDLGGAVRANPLVLALALLTVSFVAGVALRALGRHRPPVPWGGAAVTRATALVVGMLLASEVWQLHRFGRL